MKNLILGLAMMLATTLAWPPGVAQAELKFSNSSPLVACDSENAAIGLFELALERAPRVNFAMIGCSIVPNFGHVIDPSLRERFTQITASMVDFEGDPFAVFKYRTDGDPMWMIVYNPDAMKILPGQKAVR